MALAIGPDGPALLGIVGVLDGIPVIELKDIARHIATPSKST